MTPPSQSEELAETPEVTLGIALLIVAVATVAAVVAAGVWWLG